MSKAVNSKLCHIGDRSYYVGVTKFREETKIHIRQYFTAYPKKLFPSKVGVTLNIKEYLDILATGEKVKGYISDIGCVKEKCKDKKKKDHTSAGTSYSSDIEGVKEKPKERKRKEVLSSSSSSSSDEELDNEPRRKKIKRV